MGKTAKGGDGREISTGDNSGFNVAAAELLQFIERIERLEEEKQSIADDVKDVYGEMKSRGYDTKQVKRVIARRKKDVSEVLEEDSVFETYLHALGMLAEGRLPGTDA
ncbi:DUF2312 domain-containing protein [Rhizobium phage RHph_Y52]|nr:DUF2312 domain-containing protein [Rhizobium phage RHph_Y21]QIG76721.1 DUF2312 domain-containing protein [Rhizobium phage RHph_Y52]